MNDKEYVVKSISVKDFLAVLSAKWLFIVLVALLGAVFMFVKVEYFTVDVYGSDGILVVSNVDNALQNEVVKFTASDMDSSRSLCSSCIELLNSRGFYERVSEELGGKLSSSQISKMIAISARNDTDVMDVKVISTSAKGAYELADCVMKTAPEYISEIYYKDVVRPAADAYKPDAPLSKSLSTNVIIGFFVGAVIALVIILLTFYFDDRVRTSEDISNKYDLPILGEINI